MKSNGIFLYKDKCRVLYFFLGWLFASQKMREMLCISRPEFALQTRAIRGSAIAPAASLASFSPVATFGALTILATVCKSNTQN